ncbi:MAG: DUF5717 family protein [Defluviitaleaceae bacterium]|nr:DUF5717 family protein [Defluviitaleaceae bacterium]
MVGESGAGHNFLSNFEKQVNALELKLSLNPTVDAAVAFSLRCWLGHKLAPDGAKLLHKANHSALSALRKNESDIRLYMLAIFISIEYDRLDHANEMLDAAMGYRPFLKNNEPFYYAVLNFLYARLEIKQKRVRSARKHIRSFNDFVRPKDDGAQDPAFLCMAGILHLELGERPEAAICLRRSYASGLRSIFLYEALYRHYRDGCEQDESSGDPAEASVFQDVMRWASSRTADVSGMAEAYLSSGGDAAALSLRAAVEENLDAAKRVYAECGDPIILGEICNAHIKNKDYGREAFFYYREAERKQIYVGGLYQFIVKSAYANRDEHVSRYVMNEFLRVAKDNMEIGLRIFVYHLLLTDPALADFVPERRNQILQASSRCLENKLAGREANSVHCFYLEQCLLMGISGEETDKAAEALEADLTRYELRISGDTPARFVGVSGPEKKGMDIYELTPDGEGCAALIEAAGDNFSTVCFGSGRKNVVEADISVRKLVENASADICLRLFKKGSRDFFSMARLANFWLEKMDGADKRMPAQINDSVAVLEALLGHKDASKTYRMRICVALGGICYKAGLFDKALAYYGEVDENDLHEYIEPILGVYLQTNEWARAAGLIRRKAGRISNKALFGAVKKLAGYESVRADLAEAAYGLLLDAWYDPALLEIVISEYNGSQSEWEALCRALAAINASAPGLDEIIIKNSIWMHQFDADAQKAFVRISDAYGGPDVAHPLISPFVEYCAYEMIVNGAKPEYETLALLEKIYLKRREKSEDPREQDELLAWALCHVYLKHGINTFNSDRIWEMAVASQEEAGILLPVFRDYRDRREKRPYIEKNQPFLYAGLPGKNVMLYYKSEGDEAYRAKRMKYLKFGMYVACLPVFFGETLTFFYSEELPTGSTTTREQTVSNESVYVDESGDDFFTLNNAFIYERMFKYEQVEQIITGLAKSANRVRGKLI